MRKIIVLSLAIMLCAMSVFAQSQSTTGNIEGRVVDPNGAVVPNIAVSTTNQDTGFGKTTMTGSDGSYIFVLLPPGNYKVETAAAQGFAAATYENVRVTVGAKTSLEIAVTAGGSVNVVDVNDSGQTVETSRTSISSTIDERRVINLPTNGRNFLDFATLAPGVVRDPTRSGDLAVGGQKGTLNSIQIDGASSDNTFFGQASGRTGSGRAPSQFSIDTVKEFQVNQNGFSAEFGRAAGAVINVVTKSGTNRFTGSAFEYFRDESLNALNPNLIVARRAKPFGQINQFGGTFGGPIKKDKIFFFGAYEGQRSDLPNPIVLPSLTLATTPANVQAFLGPRAVSYDISRQQDTYLLKTDLNINNRNQVWVRLNQQNFTGTNLENSGALSAAEHTGNSNVNTSTVTGNWTLTLTPTWFNELRLQYSRDKEPGLSNSENPELTVATPNGTFNIGRNNFSPRETTIKRFQFINSQTLLVGNHTVKYGVDLLFDQIFNFFPGLFSGTFAFNGGYTQLSNYLNGTAVPTSYRQSFAGAGTTGPVTNPDNKEYGFFVQDDWRVSPKLTLNLGLRYDYQKIAKPPITNSNPTLIQDPSNFNTRTTQTLLDFGYDTGFQPSDKNNFAPRVGASYAFNEKTVVRGGYGLYYARTPAILTGTAHSQNGIQVVAISITCSLIPPNVCPTYPNNFSSLPTGAFRPAANLYLFDQNYKQPFTHQARLQFEREVFKNTTFSAQYTMFRGQDLTRTRNANLFAPAPVTVNGITFQRFQTERERFGEMVTMSNTRFKPFRDYDRISLFESTAKSFYQGLSFEFNRRFADRWQFSTSYTLSKAKDDKPDQTSVVPGADDGKIAENQFDLTGEYGRSDLDVRHRFIFSPVYETGTFKYSENKVIRALLSDYVFTGIFVAQSGIAYSALVSGDPNNDGVAASDRAPGTARNEFSTPAAYIVDMRVGRIIRFGERFRLSLFAEGFNLFNRSNVQQVFNNQFAATSANGRLTGVSAVSTFGNPRIFYSGSPSFTFNSSYNREFQLGIRFDF